MRNPAEFWTSRYAKWGHTGWNNPVFYAYDQQERIALFKQQIAAIDIAPHTVLDFGCGSGDFSKVMLEKGYRVWGYDLYVDPKITHPQFAYLDTVDKLKSLSQEMGLIFSIAVMDHILDKDVFLRELSNFRRLIANQGHLILLEYALDDLAPTSNHYQALRTLDEWQKTLSISGWEMVEVKPAPHPRAAPSEGFWQYRENLLVTLLGKALRFAPTNTLLVAVLQRYAAFAFAQNGLHPVEESPLKLICCRPK